MSLTNTLTSGVATLQSNGMLIGAIADNIANKNTIGAKANEVSFITTVSNSGDAGVSGGSVRSEMYKDIESQGIVESTGVASDLAVRGDGFFVVNEQADGQGAFFYTRNGSFRKDSLGNFVNSAGHYLMAWPLDSQGRLPGEAGNINSTSNALLESTQSVNVQSVSGIASATTEVKLGLNLDASQATFQGAGDTISINKNSLFNSNNNSTEIIFPNANNGLTIGDGFAVTSGGETLQLTYGGYDISNNIAGGIYGATTPTQTFTNAQEGDSFTISTQTTGAVTFSYTNLPADASRGTFNNLTNLAAAIDQTPGLSARIVSGQLYISPIDANEAMQFADVSGTATQTVNLAQANGGIGVLGATDETTVFTTDVMNGTITAGDSFTITYLDTNTSTVKTVQVEYQNPPGASTNQFNNLTSLAAAINFASNTGAGAELNATITGAPTVPQISIVGNSGIQISSIVSDASSSIDVPRALGLGGFATALNLQDTTAAVNRFSTLGGIHNILQSAFTVGSILENPVDTSTVDIFAQDPLQNISFANYRVDYGSSVDMNIPNPAVFGVNDTATAFSTPPTVGDGITVTIRNKTDDTTRSVNLTYGTPPDAATGVFNSVNTMMDAINDAANLGTEISATVVNGGPEQLLLTPNVGYDLVSIADYNPAGTSNVATTLGLAGTASNFLAEFGLAEGPFGPSYDATGSTAANLAGGKISPHFSRNVRMFDSLGNGHDFQVSYLKMAQNTWGVEVYAIDPTEISTTRTDGQIAAGTVIFNGDGTLRTVSDGLTNEIAVVWNNGAIPNNVSFGFGTAGQPAGTTGATQIGLTDGLSQFNADFNVKFVETDGVESGLLNNVEITDDGTVLAHFSNGETQQMFRIPLADFANPNGLVELDGNVFSSGQDSGEYNLRSAGQAGTGSIVAGAVEKPNIELAEQLTKLIVGTQNYKAGAKLIQTADDLLEELVRNVG